MPYYHSMKVVLLKCETYRKSILKATIERGFNLLGCTDLIKRGDRVLLKPNLLTAKPPSAAVTTHPMVVESVAEWVIDHGGKVLIGDSPGGALKDMENLWTITGMRAVANKVGAELLNLNRYPIKIVDDLHISKICYDVDMIVNLPKLKTHSLTGMTLAVKNLFGLVPGLYKSYLHRVYPDPISFTKLLLKLYRLIPSHVSVLDGILGMEGNGPSAGEPKAFGILGVADDALAMDFAIAKLARISGRIFPEIKVVPTPTYELISEVTTLRIRMPQTRVVNLILPTVWRYIYSLLFSYRPVITSNCRACGVCADSCPVNAISGPPYSIDHRKCILCTCCYEVCPHGAIKIKRSIFKL